MQRDYRRLLPSVVLLVSGLLGCGTPGYDEKVRARLAEIEAGGGRVESKEEEQSQPEDTFVEVTPEEQALFDARLEKIRRGENWEEDEKLNGAGAPTEGDATTEGDAAGDAATDEPAADVPADDEAPVADETTTENGGETDEQ